MTVHHSATRIVILTRHRAYKLPSVRGLRRFLWGLLANMAERERSGAPGLCPVLWSMPGGLLVVMPRAERAPLDLLPDPGSAPADDPDAWKPDSYGLLNGEVVRVDYHGACWLKDAA